MSYNRAQDHNCQYRSLYEGSQASLTDMAAQQAVALTRLGRVRMGIVETLKRVFPQQFSSAETALGGRLSSVDDEVLLAYVNAFCLQLTATTSGPPAGLDQLRGALTLAGFKVPVGTDLREWAGSISARPAPLAAAPVAAAAPAPAAASATPASSAAAPAGANDLAALFGDDPDWGAPLIFDDEDAPPHPAAAHAPAPAPAASRTKKSTGKGATKSSNAAGKSNPATSSYDDPYADIPVDISAVPHWPDVDIVDAPSVSDLFGADDELSAAVEPPVVSGGDDAVPVLANLDVYAPSTSMPTTLTSPSTPAATAPASIEPSAPATTPWPEPATMPAAAPASVGAPAPVVPTGPSPDAASAAAAAAAATSAVPGLTTPLRPTTLFPTAGTTKTKRRRSPRVSATAPSDPDVPFQASAAFEGDDNLQSKILASVAIPRPVFVSDLASLTGSMESAEGWERAQRGQNTPLRFVSAKTRHRARGSLVLPHDKTLREAATGFDENSWWAQCMATYRGAKLYELAVLLHSVGDQVVGHHLTNDLAVFRLNTRSGLVGLVVALDPKLGAGEPGRAALTEAVDGLLKERLTMLAVLATDDATLEKAQTALVEEKQARGWQPATMVVAARSWAYAANPGGSVQAIF